jgi:antitoxin ParD1/3/4
MSGSIDLGSKLEKVVATLIKSGRYASKSEVLREGVRLVQEREARLAALDAAVARGVSDADAGRVKPIAEVFDRLDARYQAPAKAKRR